MAEGIELGVANVSTKYFCHQCSREVSPSFSSELLCPVCYSSFLEEVTDTDNFRTLVDYDSDFGEEDLSLIHETRFDHRRFISRMFDYLHQPTEIGPLVNESEVNEETSENSDQLEFVELFREAEDLDLLNNVDDVFRVRYFDGVYGTENDVDAIASQLLDEVEISGPPPLSKEQIKSLPVVTFATEKDVRERQCTICMNDFKVGEKAKKLTCNHLFHEKCISPWLVKQASCPNCRSVVKVECKNKHCPNCPRLLQTGNQSRSRSFSPGDNFFATSLNPFRLI